MKNKIVHGNISYSPLITQYSNQNRILFRLIQKCLVDHSICRFGSISFHDKEVNKYNILKKKRRVISEFKIPKFWVSIPQNIWVITDLENNTTVVLFPEEYGSICIY